MKTLWWLALMAGMLLGCKPQSGPEFTGTDITGAPFGRQFALQDHNRQPRTLADFKGKVVAIFFGYTHCPDVCPTTLTDLKAALQLLGPDAAAQIQVLFVTVDPERDTPEVLRQYVPYFHPGFLGLYGTPAQVAETAKEFKVHYAKHTEAGASDYLVDHTAATYVFDRQGRIRLFWPYGHPAKDMAQDLKQLLGQS
ncbi:MAG: SCO family protein [Hydrogenophilaceae bacterium]|nr:SCO family protein [Hydrogenophilaceae bacterium]